MTAAIFIVILEHLNDRQVSTDQFVELEHRRFRVALHCDNRWMVLRIMGRSSVLVPEYRLLGMC